MSQENVEVVRRMLEAFQEGLERGEPAAAFETGTLAADAEWLTPDLMGGGSLSRP
jgi:ketosteroid isomerase-like protein